MLRSQVWRGKLWFSDFIYLVVYFSRISKSSSFRSSKDQIGITSCLEMSLPLEEMRYIVSPFMLIYSDGDLSASVKRTTINLVSSVKLALLSVLVDESEQILPTHLLVVGFRSSLVTVLPTSRS